MKIKAAWLVLALLAVLGAANGQTDLIKFVNVPVVK